MLGPARILLTAVILIGLAWALVRSLRSYLRYKNRMVVTCPETDRQVGVDVDARRAAIRGVLGSGSLRLTDCTRWPERQACGQECLSQIEASPEACMIRKRLEGWYQGKACACCDKEIGEVHWHEHKPALLSPERMLLQWENVAAEEMARVLSTHEPVCGTCNLAEKW
jgi:hypothetical protein